MEEIKGSEGSVGSVGSVGSGSSAGVIAGGSTGVIAGRSRGSTARKAAVIVTAIALLAIAIPFVWSPNEEPGTATSGDTSLAPPARPETTTAAAAGEDPAGAACMANAKTANFDFTMKDVDGNDVSLTAYKGKVVLLNFWATWCGPCKAEIPGFVRLQEKYRDKGLVIVGYSVDDTAAKAKAYAAEYKMNYPILLGEGREDVQDAYGPIWGIPASFIISKDGKVCRKHLGIAPETLFEKELVPLL